MAMDKFRYKTVDGDEIVIPFQEDVPGFGGILLDHGDSPQGTLFHLLKAALKTDKKAETAYRKMTSKDVEAFSTAWAKGDRDRGVASLGESSAS